MSIKSVTPSNRFILSSPSPPALNLSQHQGPFQWVSSSHQVAKVLELQLQHQSFPWVFRTDFLYDWLFQISTFYLHFAFLGDLSPGKILWLERWRFLSLERDFYYWGVCVHAKSLQSYLTLCDPMGCSPTRYLCPWDSKGKNTGMGLHSPLQNIFPTQIDLGLLHLLCWQVGSLSLAHHLGSPLMRCSSWKHQKSTLADLSKKLLEVMFIRNILEESATSLERHTQKIGRNQMKPGSREHGH